MITSKQRKFFKKIIGSKHCHKIQQFMEQQGIHSQLGAPYSTGFISEVFNGKVENATIEKAIWDFIDHLIKERKAQEARLNAYIEETKAMNHE